MRKYNGCKSFINLIILLLLIKLNLKLYRRINKMLESKIKF